MNDDAGDRYTRLSLQEYRELFSSLSGPDSSILTGDFRAEFIGPAWLRWLAPKLLPLGGLKGWFGKSLKENGSAINLLAQGSQLIEKVPMSPELKGSRFDQKNAYVLSYDKRAPLGCRKLIDEIRVIDDQRLLGMTVVDVPVLRRFAMPFLLRRESGLNVDR